MKLWAVALTLAGVLMTGGVARADTVTVTTHSDPAGPAVACPGLNCSLRQAVATAPDGSTIVFADPGTYTVDQGSPIVIPRSLTIDGGGDVTVDGRDNIGTGGTYRIFTVNSGVTADIENLTLTGAHDVIEHCCSTRNEDGGGALFVPAGAAARVNRVVFAHDSAFVGGAVTSAGTLTVVDSWFHDDNGAFGGGIAAKGGTVTMDRTTLEDEQGEAGAVYVYSGARVTITNSTVYGSGQANSRGGGLDNDAGTLTLLNDTLAGNLRGSLETNLGGTTSVKDTIVGDGFSDGDTDCVASGLAAADGRTTAKAITNDQGGNLDEDGSCGLAAGNGGHPDGAAHLAPPADNGGPVPTMALLHGSDALDAGAACPAVDERGQPRPDGAACDIGAFEAVRHAAPASAQTQPATDIGPYGATLHAAVGLSGEAGGAHFVWGPAEDDLSSVTGVGASGTGPAAAVLLDGLQPKTTYYFRAVADNASDQLPADNVLSFTTGATPPTVTAAEVDDVEDTSATLSFDVDTGGGATSYVIEYGPDDGYGQTTAPVDIGADPQRQSITAKLTGLTPGSTYHVNVVVTNASAPNGVAGSDNTFTTDPQVAGDVGSVVTVAACGAMGTAASARAAPTARRRSGARGGWYGTAAPAR
jgi:Fibronectin type III domain